MQLSTLNTLPEPEAAEFFRACCSAPGYVSGMSEARPFSSVEVACRASDTTIDAMSDTDVDAAIAGHPRIGEKPSGADASSDHSRREQASMNDADAAVRAQLREANAAYEARFDRVFLIRAAGRNPQEMLTEARRRVNNSPAAEISEVREQLRQITRLRLEQSLDEGAAS